MKYLIYLLFTVVIFQSNNMSQTFSITPDKPEPGEEVIVKYNPLGTVLANAEKIELFAYTYSKELTDKKSNVMEKEGNTWTGSFTSDENDLGAVVVFSSGELTDDNKKTGYTVYLYDDKGEILPGSMAGLGYANYTWLSWYLNFDRNPGLAYDLMTKDFEKNPPLKKDYVKYYIPVAATVNKEKSQEIIKEGAELLEKKSEFTDDDYLTLVEFYSRLKDSVKADKYEKIALEKFPTGTVAQMKDASDISILTNIDEKVSAVNKFGKKYPDSRYLPGIHNSIIKGYLESGDMENLKSFLLNNKDYIHPYYIQNTVLQMIDKKADNKIILEVASAAIEAVIENQKKEEKPEYMTESEWIKSKEEMMGQAMYVKGRVLYESGKKSEALDLLQTAGEKLNYEETEINLYLAKTLYDLGNYDETLDKVSEFIKEGNSSEEMTPLVENSYEKVKGTKDGFKEYLTDLEETANKKIAARLMSEMINETAPAFKLVNLEGNEFSLDQLKGKIVFIDFWATWCGPCKSSFPGLKKVVEKYSGRDDVMFLFINSWERVENKKENAQKFMTDNAYPFNVLLDLDNQVIEKYKVSGIPTKFIIDKKGNIRFKSVGYSGDNNKMIAEINAMISLLNKL